MSVRKLAIGVATVILSAVLSHSAMAVDRVIGNWYDDSGRGAVQITQCGAELCGWIYWLKQPTDENGRPLTDRLNPDPQFRDRPICGLQIIAGLEKQQDGSWDNGRIYDPKQGAAFDVQISLASPDRLEVVGYKGLKLFSRRFVWQRAPDSLEPCTPPQSG